MAWEIAIGRGISAIGLSTKISDAIRLQMKSGKTNPVLIADAAMETLNFTALTLRERRTKQPLCDFAA